MNKRILVYSIPGKTQSVFPVIYVEKSFPYKNFLFGFIFPEDTPENHATVKEYSWSPSVNMQFRYLGNDNGKDVLKLPEIMLPADINNIQLVVQEWENSSEEKLEDIFGRVLLFTDNNKEPIAIFPRLDKYEEL